LRQEGTIVVGHVSEPAVEDLGEVIPLQPERLTLMLDSAAKMRHELADHLYALRLLGFLGVDIRPRPGPKP